jgi:ABC-type uncharacterized transport system substrate-binding protein
MKVVSWRAALGERVVMAKFILFWLLILLLLIYAQIAEAQQPKKVPRIGYLTVASLTEEASSIEAFRRGLRELGYVDGQNVSIEQRSATGMYERLPELAVELVQLKVDFILTGGTSATRAAQKATSTIPIVMAVSSDDPVGSGFVVSLARPGGNITGLTSIARELSGKRLELLKEAVTKAGRVAVLWNPDNPGHKLRLKEIEIAARPLGMMLQALAARSLNELESAFRTASTGAADAMMVTSDALFNTYKQRIVELASKTRLPATYDRNDYVEAGGLMSYGVDVDDLYRRAAYYADKILKGAKPADLPVEQPTKFEFVINLKAAKQIGLTIPPNVLARADRVIK